MRHFLYLMQRTNRNHEILQSEKEFADSLKRFQSLVPRSGESFLSTFASLIFEKILNDWSIPASLITKINNKIKKTTNNKEIEHGIKEEFNNHFSAFRFVFEKDIETATNIAITLHENTHKDSALIANTRPEEPTSLSSSNKLNDKIVCSIEFLYYIFEKLLKNEIDIKGSGSYYTPKPITEYICSAAIDMYLLNFDCDFLSQIPSHISSIQTINEIKDLPDAVRPKIWRSLSDKLMRLRIADICCGSGAFLLSLAEILFQRYYLFNAQSGDDKIDARNAKDLRQLKKLILDNCIFGVELNPDARMLALQLLYLWYFNPYSSLESDLKAESCKLHLDNDELPNLEKNIRQGNSLIGWVGDESEFISNNRSHDLNSDFHSRYCPDLTESEFEKLIPFHWLHEFSDIFPEKKFNITVGNPPYLSYLSSKAEKGYLIDRSLLNRIFGRIDDLYEAFLIRSLQLCHGISGFIIPYNIHRSFIHRILPNLLRYDNLGEGLFNNMSGAVSIVFYQSRPCNSGSKENLLSEGKTQMHQFEFCNYLGFSSAEKLSMIGTKSYLKITDLDFWRQDEIIVYLLSHSKRYKDYNIKIQRGEELGRKAVNIQNGIPVFSAAELNPYFVIDTNFKIDSRTIGKHFHYSEKIGFNLAFRNRIKAAYFGKRITIKSVLAAYGTTRENLMILLGIWNSMLMDWFHQIKYCQFEERRVNRIQDIVDEYPVLLDARSALPLIVPFMICKYTDNSLIELIDFLVLELFFSDLLFKGYPESLPISKALFSCLSLTSSDLEKLWKWIETEEKRQCLGLDSYEMKDFQDLTEQISNLKAETVHKIKESQSLLGLIRTIKHHTWFSKIKSRS